MSVADAARSRYATLAALALIGLAALAVGFVGDPNVRIQRYARFAVPVLWANLALVAALALRAARAWRLAEVRAELRSGAVAAAAIAVLVAGLALLVPAQMRIQMDEAQIAGTAYGVWAQQAPILPATGIVDAQGIHPYTLSVDKRGALLPVLLSLAQSPGAFVLERGYALNLALGFAALLAFYALLRRWWRPEVALAGVLFLAANPTFAWCMRSIELEMLNLLLLALAGLALVSTLRTRDTRYALLLVWLGPLLAQGRYESAIASVLGLAIAAVVIARAGPRPWERLLLLAAPLAYLPLAWQRAKPFEFGLGQIGSDHAFGLDHFWNHLVGALNFFGRPNALDPLAPLQLALALLAVLLLVPAWRAAARDAPDRLALPAIRAAVLGITAVVFALAWGNLNSPTDVRLGLPLMMAIAAAAAGALDRLRGRKLLPPGGVALVAGVALLASTPAIRSDAGYGDMLAGPGLNHAMAWSRDALPQCRALYVSPYAQYFLTRQRSSLRPADLRERWPMVQAAARAGVVDLVLAVQLGDLKTNRPVAENVLPDGFEARELLSERAGPAVAVRVSALDDPSSRLESRNPACRLPPAR